MQRGAVKAEEEEAEEDAERKKDHDAQHLEVNRNMRGIYEGN